MSDETCPIDVVCKICGWAGNSSDCPPAMSVYHDLCCPQCQTTYLDTSGVLKSWPEYGYGGDNTLIMKGKP